MKTSTSIVLFFIIVSLLIFILNYFYGFESQKEFFAGILAEIPMLFYFYFSYKDKND